MECLLQSCQTFRFSFRETLYRNFRPGGYGFCDFFFCYLQFFVFATAFKAFSDLLQIFFELLLARLQFFCMLKIAGTDRGFFFFLYFEQCLLLFCHVVRHLVAGELYACGCLIDQIDGFIRQETVVDVADAHFYGCFQCFIGDFHAVVAFVVWAQAF